MTRCCPGYVGFVRCLRHLRSRNSHIQAWILFWYLRYCTGFHPGLSFIRYWFSSYLSGRTQSVIIGKTTSNPRPVDFGVPQGSILGPLLFNLYVAPLQDIVAANNLNSMFYADDSQIYIAIKPNDQSSTLATLRNCINAITNWNTQNMLLCNSGKPKLSNLPLALFETLSFLNFRLVTR